MSNKMLQKIKDIWKSWTTNGIFLPFAHDPTTNKPSITLFFPYATFCLSTLSIVALHFKKDLAIATWTTIGFWIIATVLYMLRRITKAKFDLDDKSIELDSTDDKEEKSPSSTVTNPDAT